MNNVCGTRLETVHTCESHEEAENPRSRAKDHSCLLDVATSLKQHEQRRMMTIEAMTVAAALLPVTL